MRKAACKQTAGQTRFLWFINDATSKCLCVFPLPKIRLSRGLFNIKGLSSCYILGTTSPAGFFISFFDCWYRLISIFSDFVTFLAASVTMLSLPAFLSDGVTVHYETASFAFLSVLADGLSAPERMWPQSDSNVLWHRVYVDHYRVNRGGATNHSLMLPFIFLRNSPPSSGSRSWIKLDKWDMVKGEEHAWAQ